MTWIKEEDQKYLKQEFEKYLKDDVDLNLFVSRNDDCKYCKETEELLNELVSIDKRLHLNDHGLPGARGGGRIRFEIHDGSRLEVPG